jgi:hypothetical protein
MANRLGIIVSVILLLLLKLVTGMTKHWGVNVGSDVGRLVNELDQLDCKEPDVEAINLSMILSNGTSSASPAETVRRDQ